MTGYTKPYENRSVDHIKTHMASLKLMAQLGVLVLFFVQLTFFFLNADFVNHLMALVAYSFFGGILYFVSKEKYLTVKYFFCFGGMVVTVINHYIYGSHIGIVVFYLLNILMAASFYNFKTSLLITFINIALYVGMQSYLNTFSQGGEDFEYSVVIKVIVFLFGIASISRFFRKVFDELSNNYSIKKKQNVELKAFNEDLRKFNVLLVNNLKSPIYNIVSFSDLLSKGDLSPETEKCYLDSILEIGNQLNESVNSIKKLQELVTMSHPIEPITITDITSELKEEFSLAFSSLNIRLDSLDSAQIYTYRLPLYKVLCLLIEYFKQKNQAPDLTIEIGYVSNNQNENCISLKCLKSDQNQADLDENYTQIKMDSGHNQDPELLIVSRIVEHIQGKLYKNDSAFNLFLPNKIQEI